MEVDILTIVTASTTVISTVYAGLYVKRAKRAEVTVKESEVRVKELESLSSHITAADQMVELVKKANAEATEIRIKDNEKLRKSITRLEKAIRSVSTCVHRSECPVSVQLQDSKDIDQ